MRRFAIFLYSTKNIVASALGVAALGAFFGGAIHDFWYAIVAGAYAIGYVGAPGNPTLETQLNDAMDMATMEASLKRLVADVTAKVTPDVAALVQSIADSIITVRPLLAKNPMIGDANAYTIRHTALEYLPETLQAYLKLPPAFRNTYTIQDGKTPRQILVDQLTLLDAKMKEIAANLLAGDTQALLANGNFLKEKFKADTFLAPA